LRAALAALAWQWPRPACTIVVWTGTQSRAASRNISASIVVFVMRHSFMLMCVLTHEREAIDDQTFGPLLGFQPSAFVTLLWLLRPARP
jgi:hypothetical protein